MTLAVAGIIVESEIGEANRDRYISEIRTLQRRPDDARQLRNLARDFAQSFAQCAWADILKKKSCGSYEY